MKEVEERMVRNESEGCEDGWGGVNIQDVVI